MTANEKLDALITATKQAGAFSVYIHEDSSTQRAVTDYCVARIQAAGLLAIPGVHVIGGTESIGSPTPPVYGYTVNLRDGNWPDPNRRRLAAVMVLQVLRAPSMPKPQCIWWFGFDACSDEGLKTWLVKMLATIPTPAKYPGQPDKPPFIDPTPTVDVPVTHPVTPKPSHKALEMAIGAGAAAALVALIAAKARQHPSMTDAELLAAVEQQADAIIAKGEAFLKDKG